MQRLDDSSYRLFTRRLLHFYKPSSGLFANTDLTHDLAQVYAQALLHFCDFLLGASEVGSLKFVVIFCLFICLLIDAIYLECLAGVSQLYEFELTT